MFVSLDEILSVEKEGDPICLNMDTTRADPWLSSINISTDYEAQMAHQSEQRKVEACLVKFQVSPL